MKKAHIALSAIVALGLSSQVLAEGVSYSYVEADLLGSQLKGFGDTLDGDGFRLKASAAIGAEWFSFVDIGRTKYTEAGDSFKLTPIEIGIGYHTMLGQSVHLVGTVSYDRLKAALTGFGSATESGWGLGAGLRGMAGEKVEWSAGLRYRDVGDYESIVGVSVGGRYHFTPVFAVGIDLTSEKYDEDAFDVTERIAALTFRYSFGS